MTKPAPAPGMSSRRTLPGSDIQAEIEAAILNLGAERLDLEALLIPIKDRAVSRLHFKGLLKQAWNRLQKLRSALHQFLEQGAVAPSVADAVKEADAALVTGRSFSIANASNALDAARKRSLEQQAAHVVAAILGMQAMVAMLRQDYRGASARYIKAAETAEPDAGLQWHYGHESVLALVDLGREFEDNAALEEAISLLENDIMTLARGTARASHLATTQNSLGNACGILGQRQRGTRNLENAISAYEASLENRVREDEPLEWAATQNNLGNALGILAHRHNDEEMLGKAVEVFNQALEERTRELAPQDWAITKNNLAAVLQPLGQRNKDVKMLKQAVEAYKAVLQIWTRERVPLDWATTMNNLGTALRLLGENRKGPRTLEQSVAAYKSALSVRTRDHLPQEWAMTQNNLGAALQKLAEREENPETLIRAIDAYESALMEWNRDRVPMTWAMTMGNLAVARKTLAEVTEDRESAVKAVEELEAVCDVFRELSHAQYSELSIDQLAKARKLANALTAAG